MPGSSPATEKLPLASVTTIFTWSAELASTSTMAPSCGTPAVLRTVPRMAPGLMAALAARLHSIAMVRIPSLRVILCVIRPPNGSAPAADTGGPEGLVEQGAHPEAVHHGGLPEC